MRKSKKLLACLMGATVMMTSVFGGCVSKTPEADLENAPDYSQSTGQFNIWAYGQVMDDNYMNRGETYYFYDENGNKISLQTPERTKWLADANFNTVYLGSVFSTSYSKRYDDGSTYWETSEVKKVMDMCHEVGLKVFVFGQEFYQLTNLDNGQSRINKTEADKLKAKWGEVFVEEIKTEESNRIRDEYKAKYRAEYDNLTDPQMSKEEYVQTKMSENDTEITTKINSVVNNRVEEELEYYIWTNETGTNMFFETQEDLNRYAGHLLEGVKDHPAFIGVSIWDEPGYLRFQACSEVCKAFKANVPDGFIMLNMLPMSESETIQNLYCENGSKLGMVASYQKYLEAYVEYFGGTLDYFLYDDYPILQKGVLNSYLKCHQLVAEVCKENNLRKCLVMQSYAGDGAHRLVEYEDALWQANVGMAMGAKEFSYYTWWPIHNSTGNLPDETKYPLTRHGERNPLYYHIQNVNREINFNAKVLSNFVYQGMTYYDSELLPTGKPYIANLVKNNMKYLSGVSFEVKLQDGALLLIAEHYDATNDQYGYYVVNATDPVATNEAIVTLTFNDFDNVQIMQSETITNVRLNNHKITFELATGRGAFLMPY